MNFRIKSIEQLRLKDMPYLLQPSRACSVVRSALRNTGMDSFYHRSLYSNGIFGLKHFIDRYLQTQQRYGFQMRYGNSMPNSGDDPQSNAIEAMVTQGQAFIVFRHNGLRYNPLLIPPWFLGNKDQHWSLDTGPGSSFTNYTEQFKFILEKRLRELQVTADQETGKIIATGRSHMAWMESNPRAYRIGEPAEPTPPEPQLRPMEPMPPTHWVELKHQFNYQDDKGQIEPAAGVPFRLTLPDGKVETSKLDSNGFASFSGIKPGICTVNYDPEFENDLKAAQQALQDELNQIIAARRLEKAKWDAEFDAKSSGEQAETLVTGTGRGFNNSMQGIAELLEAFAKIKQDPLILPTKAIEGYKSGKQLVKQIREIPDEEIKAYAIIAADPKTWKILSDFAGDYLDTLTAEEVAELGGAAIPDLILLVVTGGSGTAASAGSKLSKLKHIKKLLMELVEVLKRKPAVGTNSGPNNTMIKSTNRLRAGEGGIIGGKSTAPSGKVAPNGDNNSLLVQELEPGNPRSSSLPRNGDRLILDQGNLPTCGPNSCAMVLDSSGKTYDLNKLIIDSKVTDQGAYMGDMAKALRNQGLDTARIRNGVSLDELAQATAKGNPAVVATRLDRGGHAVVIDGITTRQGQAVVAIRDPALGRQYFTPLSEFADRFTGQAILTNPKP